MLLDLRRERGIVGFGDGADAVRQVGHRAGDAVVVDEQGVDDLKLGVVAASCVMPILPGPIIIPDPSCRGRAWRTGRSPAARLRMRRVGISADAERHDKRREPASLVRVFMDASLFDVATHPAEHVAGSIGRSARAHMIGVIRGEPITGLNLTDGDPAR